MNGHKRTYSVFLRTPCCNRVAEVTVLAGAEAVYLHCCATYTLTLTPTTMTTRRE